MDIHCNTENLKGFKISFCFSCTILTNHSTTKSKNANKFYDSLYWYHAWFPTCNNSGETPKFPSEFACLRLITPWHPCPSKDPLHTAILPFRPLHLQWLYFHYHSICHWYVADDMCLGTENRLKWLSFVVVYGNHNRDQIILLFRTMRKIEGLPKKSLSEGKKELFCSWG